jgi:peroxiredoxin
VTRFALPACAALVTAIALQGAHVPRLTGDDAPGSPAAEPPAPVGTRVADFTLPDAATGRPWSLAEHARDAKAVVVVFTTAGCPVSNAYAPKLAALHKRYARDGVVVVGVNSHPAESAADAARHAKEYQIPFPVLKDDGVKLADKFAVDRLPTAFVLDAGRVVRYKGRIDDQFAPGVHRPEAATRELGVALDAVLDGREVRTPFAAPAGCRLTREKQAGSTTLTYHKDILPILQARCQECHRPGEAGPFSLMSYKQAKGWADMIAEVVADGRMPPWHADAPRGHFANDRRLADAEKKALLAWVEAGCPEGDPADAPPPKRFADGWRLGREPDEVIRMNAAVDVPAQFLFGLGMPYKYVLAGEPIPEDRWVQAVEVRPEYRAVVHHIIVFVVPPGKNLRELDLKDFGQYMLGAYVPGDQPTVFPAGLAKKLPKGSRLLFEAHYTPNGRPGTDRSMVGLVYAKEPPRHEVKTKAIKNERFVIPPRGPNHEVVSSFAPGRPITVLSMTPHMHVRGKAFRFEVLRPGRDPEVLLNVPRYDFNWQVAYAPARPLELPADARIKCTAWYDNSPVNPANPDPDRAVRWGKQTWEEMMIGFIEYYEN